MFKKLPLYLIITAQLCSEIPFKQLSDSLTLVSKYEKEEMIITLGDHSAWSIKKIQSKRNRSIGEWWNNKTPLEWELDETYFCDPKKWSEAATISVYQASKTPFQGYDFILENQINHEKIFAKYLPQSMQMIPKLDYIKKFFSYPFHDVCKLVISDETLDPIVGLEDLTLWRISPFSYNSRSLWQWINSEVIDQPDDCFVFDLSNWKLLDEIQVYAISDTNFENKYNKSQTKVHSYLIENLSRNQYAYATPIKFQELIESYKQRIQDSYYKGYNLGFDNGYNKGFSEGFKAAKLEEENRNIDK